VLYVLYIRVKKYERSKRLVGLKSAGRCLLKYALFFLLASVKGSLKLECIFSELQLLFA